MPACPGHVDFVPGHVKLCAYVPDWASDFSGWAHVYFFSSMHSLYRACSSIGWAHENFCRAHKFSEPCARWACKPNSYCRPLDIAALCAKYQNDWATEIGVIEKHDFARFAFNSLWHSDVIWRYRTGSVWAQVLSDADDTKPLTEPMLTFQ